MKARFGLVHFERVNGRFWPRNFRTLAVLVERRPGFVFIVRLECEGEIPCYYLYTLPPMEANSRLQCGGMNQMSFCTGIYGRNFSHRKPAAMGRRSVELFTTEGSASS